MAAAAAATAMLEAQGASPAEIAAGAAAAGARAAGSSPEEIAAAAAAAAAAAPPRTNSHLFLPLTVHLVDIWYRICGRTFAHNPG